MPDRDFDDAELQRIALIGEPRAGDDDQLVAFRAIVRVTHKIARSQREALTRIRAVEVATGACDDTHRMVESLTAALAPVDAPKSHMTVRVDALETMLAGWRGTFAKIAFPVVIALTLAALGFAWTASVDATAARHQASVAKIAP